VGIILGPGQFNWDVALVKTTKVGGLREDATLHSVRNFSTHSTTRSSTAPSGQLDVSKTTNFGQITSTSVNPRLIQFALKYVF
jgi:hypothetical protein